MTDEPRFENIGTFSREHLRGELHEAVDRLFEEPNEADRLMHAERVATDIGKFMAAALEHVDIVIGRHATDEFHFASGEAVEAWAALGRTARSEFGELSPEQQQLSALAVLRLIGSNTGPSAMAAIHRALSRARIGSEDQLLATLVPRRGAEPMTKEHDRLVALSCREFLHSCDRLSSREAGEQMIAELFGTSVKRVQAWRRELWATFGQAHVDDTLQAARLAGRRWRQFRIVARDVGLADDERDELMMIENRYGERRLLAVVVGFHKTQKDGRDATTSAKSAAETIGRFLTRPPS